MGNAASKGATKKNANAGSPTKSGSTRKANGPTFEDRLAEQQALRKAERAAHNAKRNAERSALTAKRNAEKAERNAERATRNAERAARNAQRIVNAAERKRARNAQIEVFKEECKAEAKEAKKAFIESWKVQLAGKPVTDELRQLADNHEASVFTVCYTTKLLNM